jgi:hypothetical protein
MDGGDIKGLSGLVILHEIMKRVQVKEKFDDLPRPCDVCFTEAQNPDKYLVN